MRTIDTREYISMLRDLTKEGHDVSLIISGSSMSPFLIHQRDTVRFRKPDRPLRAGDIVFYQRRSGQFVMHRILSVHPEGYYIAGDAQTVVEGPVLRDQIFGLITCVCRKGRWIGPGDFWWQFFATFWRRILVLRPVFIRGYSIIYRIRQKLSAHR